MQRHLSGNGTRLSGRGSTLLALLVVLALPAAGCKRKPERAAVSPSVRKSDVPGLAEVHQMTVATFNAGLARNFVPFAEERVPAVAAALADLDADVACLQEVWEADDRERILDATRERFPHAFFAQTRDETDGPPGCTRQALTPLADCVRAHCSGSENLSKCVLAHCAKAFFGMSTRCRNCLTAHVSQPLEEITQACLTGAATYSWGGANGLLLLSRHPVDSTEHRVLDSYQVMRAALYGRVQTFSGPLHVFCTHLSTTLAAVPYAGAFASWEDEHAHQVQEVIGWVRERSGDQPAVLLGDLNSGPARGMNRAVFEEAFATLEFNGIHSPHLAHEKSFCTWCPSNPLVTGGEPALIDHVLFFNLDPEPDRVRAERLFTRHVALETGRGPRELPLSDHYGVLVTFPR